MTCRERAEKQRLKKEVRREQRGAVRELRKDAAFLHSVREQEKAAVQAERRGKLRAGMSFMQQQVGARPSLVVSKGLAVSKGCQGLGVWAGLRVHRAWCSACHVAAGLAPVSAVHGRAGGSYAQA